MLTSNSSGNMQTHGYLGCFHAASSRENISWVWVIEGANGPANFTKQTKTIKVMPPLKLVTAPYFSCKRSLTPAFFSQPYGIKSIVSMALTTVICTMCRSWKMFPITIMKLWRYYQYYTCRNRVGACEKLSSDLSKFTKEQKMVCFVFQSWVLKQKYVSGPGVPITDIYWLQSQPG